MPKLWLHEVRISNYLYYLGPNFPQLCYMHTGLLAEWLPCTHQRRHTWYPCSGSHKARVLWMPPS